MVTTVDLIESQVEVTISDAIGTNPMESEYFWYEHVARDVWETACWMIRWGVKVAEPQPTCVLFVWGHKGWRTARPTWRCRCVPRKCTDSGPVFKYGWRVWKPACRCVSGNHPDSNIWTSHIVQGLAWLEMNFIMILLLLYSVLTMIHSIEISIHICFVF